MIKKKALLLGGTGAMGVYLVPELLKLGFRVDVTTRRQRTSDNKRLIFIQGDGHDLAFTKKILRSGKYDVIVDFMNYNTEEFKSRYRLLLESCKHYIFLSSYRVFADSPVITENSPRLLDVSNDHEYLKTDDYALAKARQEDMLRNSTKKNWTIVRPAITYSNARFQLGTMEADTVVWRSLQNLPVILPREMLRKKTTMTWAGDVARLMAKLALVRKTMGEAFNIATSEHHTWAEVVDIYKEAIGLRVQAIGLEEYVAAMGGGFNAYQVKYDRMFDRILDNTKILHVTGEKQQDLVSLRDGLRKELTKFVKGPRFEGIDYAKQARFDKLTRTKVDLSNASPEEKRIYDELRFSRASKMRQALRPRTRFLAIKRGFRPRTRLLAFKRKLRLRTRLKGLMLSARDWFVRQKFKHADGATITLTGHYNYGNIVQRYALQEFLRKKGYKFVSYTYEPPGPIGDHMNPERLTMTAKFVEKRIWQKPFDPRDKFPAYIVGSDQVWRNWGYVDEIDGLGYYFLNFVKNPHAKRIAYAASFGKSDLKDTMMSPGFIEYIRPFVKKFDAISVRESSGVNILRQTWGVKSRHVIDPTMLLTASDYSELIQKTLYELDPVKQIFAYILSPSDEKSKLIQRVAHSTQSEVDTLNLYRVEVLPPVEQWLKGFRDAELVVTDSFHGMVFSIINNTAFVMVENADGGLARITSFLEQFGLEDRLVTDSKAGTFDTTQLEPIDWHKVNRKLAALRDRSGSWLLSSLGDESIAKSTDV